MSHKSKDLVCTFLKLQIKRCLNSPSNLDIFLQDCLYQTLVQASCLFATLYHQHVKNDDPQNAIWSPIVCIFRWWSFKVCLGFIPLSLCSTQVYEVLRGFNWNQGHWALILTFICALRVAWVESTTIFFSVVALWFLLPRVGDVPQGMQDVVLRLRDDGQHLSEALH